MSTLLKWFHNYVQVKDFMENQIILSFLNAVAAEVAASLFGAQSRENLLKSLV